MYDTSPLGDKQCHDLTHDKTEGHINLIWHDHTNSIQRLLKNKKLSTHGLKLRERKGQREDKDRDERIPSPLSSSPSFAQFYSFMCHEPTSQPLSPFTKFHCQKNIFSVTSTLNCSKVHPHQFGTYESACNTLRVSKHDILFSAISRITTVLWLMLMNYSKTWQKHCSSLKLKAFHVTRQSTVSTICFFFTTFLKQFKQLFEQMNKFK